SFSFNDPSTTEIYTLSLHDALPIYVGALPHEAGERSAQPRPRVRLGDQAPPYRGVPRAPRNPVDPSEGRVDGPPVSRRQPPAWSDRKSTRLNSSHLVISYAVFCLKK